MSMYGDNVAVSEMVGKTFDSVTRVGESIIFRNEFETYTLEHWQSCCESVYIDDLCGDLKDLEGVPLRTAEESSEDIPQEEGEYDWGGIHAYTFYRFWTSKGAVVIRWQGSSNGYYGIGISCTLDKSS